jgi:hypothetical protein
MFNITADAAAYIRKKSNDVSIKLVTHSTSTG